jgi:hypothetical protein
MFQTKVVEKINTLILFSITIFPKNHAVDEIMWKNIVEPDRPQTTVWCMHIVCWILKPTNTHSEYVILKVFHCNNGWRNMPQCYITCTLPVLFKLHTVKWVTDLCAIVHAQQNI